MTINPTPQGSIWRLWDFHCHTPASYEWSGQRLRNLEGAARDVVVAQTVAALANATPDVVVIMDYWTFDGYRAIVDYERTHPGALKGKTIFPGIELRVESSLKKQRLNVHLVLDPSVHSQELQDVLSTLKVNLNNGDRALSDACLINYARDLGADRLAKGSFDIARVAGDDDYALDVGWRTAMVTPASLDEALKQLGDKGLLLMPWDTYGGLKEIDWVAHYAEVRRLRTAAEIFECKDEGNRLAFHGVKHPLNDWYFDSFFGSLEKKARLCVRGTDAHAFSSYGVFPSGMKTWIKAEPTFRGLRHAIREPAFRSYIGDVPPKKAFVEANGRLFMNRIQLASKAGSKNNEKWFAGTDLPLNSDLVAIIGNKGSGKSGLAEVLALAGNSKAHDYFTFLVDDRFKSGNSQRAGAFEATLTWSSTDQNTVTLDQVAQADRPERVKYISQFYFEQLCNDHVSGKSDRFGAEIRKVLFSHLDAAERGNHQNLDEYLATKEQPVLERIDELRQTLHKVGVQLAEKERQTSSAHESELKEKLASKELELKDLTTKLPAQVAEPATGSQQPSEEAIRLALIASRLKMLDTETESAETAKKKLTDQRTVADSVAQRLASFEQQGNRLSDSLQAELKAAGIELANLVTVTTKRVEVDRKARDAESQILQLTSKEQERSAATKTLIAERTALQETLDKPNKAYQEYLVAVAAWKKSEKALVGAPTEAETIEFYKARLSEIAEIPKACKKLEEQQDALVKLIHGELMQIAQDRRKLFTTVEQLVEKFPGVATELKVGFQSGLFFDRQVFVQKFFDLVKRSTGGFRGDEDGTEKLNKLLRGVDFGDADAVVAVLRAVRTEITGAQQPGSSLLPILKTKVSAEELYDLLYDLKLLEAKFTLSLAGTTIQQMSPGQRGALLLIFYLLVDTDPTPLILDQPEENLDNQTVYSMLVPIIQTAKTRRQIIMVTHNANLAVCCDAEQIILAEFDRSAQFALTYESGAIESPLINKAVMDVLEGTTPAFDNRRDKYQH